MANESIRYGLVQINSLTMYFMLAIIIVAHIGNWFTFLSGRTLVPSPQEVSNSDGFFTKNTPRVIMYYCMFSLLIVFAVFVMICSSLIYIPHLTGPNDEVWSSLFQSITFVASRINIFFSEVFLVVLYTFFVFGICLKYEKHMTSLTVDRRLMGKPTWWFVAAFLVCTTVHLFIIVGSYTYQLMGPGSVMGQLFYLKKFMPVRFVQLQFVRNIFPGSIHVHDTMRCASSLLIIGSVVALTCIFTNFKYHMTDDVIDALA